MKPLLFCLVAVLWGSTWAIAQSANPHKDPADFIPPINRGEGIVNTQGDAHELERESEQAAQPGTHLRNVDLAQIRRDSDELSKLAQSISNEIAASEKGTLPKDLGENLKKVQKLSKRLRDELKL